MPMYEFVCGKCGRDFEVRQSMAERDQEGNPSCPGCGSRSVSQQLSSVNVAMGGGGADFSSDGPSCSCGTGGCCN